ncbi:MAG: band 7 protein [Chloroflexi bacterium]|nr:MAG: band 7 protein [Chloroflexota bacterium]
MWVPSGIVVGFIAWFVVRYILTSFYTVNQNERAVKTSFGRAQRLGGATIQTTPMADALRPDEQERYNWPQLRVLRPGGPYFKWPWEQVYKVSVATETINMATDLEEPTANQNGTMLEAVTKDQLNTGLEGQIRYRVSERNLYAYLFGVKKPVVHVMGYFVSVLRERIAAFEAPAALTEDDEVSAIAGISINDLRKNLSLLNDQMEAECRSSEARYGVVLDASLITAIDPPDDVESALAAINTAHNQVSSDISLAQAAADQKIVQSKRAVEIETLNAYAEVEPLTALAAQLSDLKASGPEALTAYLRNVRLKLYAQAEQVILEEKRA